MVRFVRLIVLYIKTEIALILSKFSEKGKMLVKIILEDFNNHGRLK
jgi:hypothetical protein